MSEPAPKKSIQRSERLKSAKTIAALFKGGQSFVAYPLRVVWAHSHAGETGCATVAVTVSKRNFKTAVQRNRLKRQMREAYRLHKAAFYEKISPLNQHISLMISYIAKEPVPYKEIDAGMGKLIRKFPVDVNL